MITPLSSTTMDHEKFIEEPSLVYWRPKPPRVLHQGYLDGVMVPTMQPSPIQPLSYPINAEYRAHHAYFDVHNQNSQLITNTLIQDEVIRAAKMLFSKRNRTLMHWLNPDISKHQLKIDVNAAWDSLPPPEKIFYISQVLGKFAPHMSSLMVNPHLEAKHNNIQRNGRIEQLNYCTRVKSEQINSEHCVVEKEEKYNSDNSWIKQEEIVKPIVKKENNDEEHNLINNTLQLFEEKLKISTEPIEKEVSKKPVKKKRQKRQLEYNADDEESRDSGLAMDVEMTEKPKVKRKYTKRQSKKIPITDNNGVTCWQMPVDVKDIKVEAETEPTVPQVKRKYVKHKLVRKKYKKREPRTNVIENAVPQPSSDGTLVAQKQPYEDMDLWIDLDDNLLLERFGLLNDEVDRFWETIGDPSSFFKELEI